MVEKNRRNFYRILHVQPDAPQPVIKSSYRALMLSLEMHPDLGGDHWNAALINEAYSVLSDRTRRERYDRDRLARAGRGPKHRPEPMGPDDRLRCVFCGTRAEPGLSPADRCKRCRSPLAELDKLETGGSGKRLIDRVPLRARLEYFTTWPQLKPFVGTLEDLSPNGMRFGGDTPVGEHTILKIESEVISATARVAYCRTDVGGSGPACEIGAEFFTLEFPNPTGTFLSTRA